MIYFTDYCTIYSGGIKKYWK